MKRRIQLTFKNQTDNIDEEEKTNAAAGYMINVEPAHIPLMLRAALLVLFLKPCGSPSCFAKLSTVASSGVAPHWFECSPDDFVVGVRLT